MGLLVPVGAENAWILVTKETKTTSRGANIVKCILVIVDVLSSTSSLSVSSAITFDLEYDDEGV